MSNKPHPHATPTSESSVISPLISPFMTPKYHTDLPRPSSFHMPHPLQELCRAIAVVLHYFFLTSFMWMLMEGVVLYVVLVRVFIKKQRNYVIAFTLVSYGLPALYMCLVVPLGLALSDEQGPHYGSSNVSDT